MAVRLSKIMLPEHLIRGEVMLRVPEHLPSTA
jgi:hypothetical protein